MVKYKYVNYKNSFFHKDKAQFNKKIFKEDLIMQIGKGKRILCDYDLIRFIKEEIFSINGKFEAVSITQNNKEILIFIGKNEENSTYEVRIYKCKPEDKYVPHTKDKIKSYKENEEYAEFEFDKFEDAKEFADMIPIYHKEYKTRPKMVIAWNE